MSDTDILDQLREAAPDRYSACLYLPAEFRETVAALHAFDVEIRRIPDLVTEPIPGEIRLQWWREVLRGEREDGGSPLARALLAAIAQYQLPVSAFDNYLEARKFDLYHDPMPDRDALEAYCGETVSALFQCAALCAGGEPGRALADASGHCGVALGIAEIMADSARQRMHGRCYVPEDTLSATGLTTREWLTAAPDERHGNAVVALAGLAREHYGKALGAIDNLPKPAASVFLPLATLPDRLKAIEACGSRLVVESPQIGPLRRQWRILRAAVSGLPRMGGAG